MKNLKFYKNKINYFFTIFIFSFLFSPSVVYSVPNSMGAGFELGDLITFVIPTVSTFVAQSKTDTGASISVSLQTLLLLNVSASSTRINNKTINNTYVGLAIPFFIDGSISRTFIFLNTGSGDKGKTNKYGISYATKYLNENNSIGMLLTLNREIYSNNTDFDNTQLGVTFYYLPDY